LCQSIFMTKSQKKMPACHKLAFFVFDKTLGPYVFYS